MESSVRRSSPLLNLLHLLLLLLLLGQFSSAAFSSDGVDLFPVVQDFEEEEAAESEGDHLFCITDNIDTALIQARITREKIDEFKDRYTRSKFSMTWADFNGIIPLEWDATVLEVCTVDQTCSTVLPSLPPASTPPPVTNSDAAKTLAEMSTHVFRFVYAYEQLVLDQSLNEDDFGKEIHDAYINHDQLSTLLEEVLEVCGLAGNFSDLAALHGKMHVTTSTPQTDLRGFSTLRQSLQGLDLLESMFGEGVMLLEELVEEIENEEDEEEEEEVVQRRNRRKGKGGHSRRNGKNKKGNKTRKRRNNRD